MNEMDLQRLVQSAGLSQKLSREAIQRAMNSEAQQTSILQELHRLAQNADELRRALASVSAARSGNPNIQHVENIPGRRIPFDLLVDIPIGANVTSTQQGTILISQEGPFVACARYATFLSTFELQRRDPVTGQLAAFQGRSFGRYRPVHSAWDINDGQPHSQQIQIVGAPGTGAPHVLSPGNGSPFRTMEPDFRVLFENAGSSFPRQNIEVPSAFWTTNVSDPFPLPALDVFERGEVLTFKVLPLHPNNPPFGNLSGYGAPNPIFPFLDSQWDTIEGINDQNDPAATTDPINRLANGILTIGFSGYRIVMPAGPGPY